jgi:hypothetical protein
MSQSLWRCRNSSCPSLHGAILGRVTESGGLMLAPDIRHFTIYLDTRRADIMCPACGQRREFRGAFIGS